MKTKLLQSEGKEEGMAGSNKHIGYPMDFTKEDIIERFAREIRQEPETETDLDWRS